MQFLHFSISTGSAETSFSQDWYLVDQFGVVVASFIA